MNWNTKRENSGKKNQNTQMNMQKKKSYIVGVLEK